MGVRNLWTLLSEACNTNIYISSLKDKTLAVDLSSWICELRRSQSAQSFQNLYLRNLFFRTTHLLKNGIKLVFVEDGSAPSVKRSTLLKRSGNLERTGLKLISEKCRGLLTNLGLPCIQSQGEGEALCAQLNYQGIVDGVLTSDSDALLYGARKLYRNLDIKENKVDCCDMDTVKEKLELDRKGLVTMALLCGCDYMENGVNDVGIRKAHDFIKICVEKNTDPLGRIKNWRTNSDLIELQKSKDNLHKKESHCTVCKHLGKKHEHFKEGCRPCGTDQSCDQYNDISCRCQHCRVEFNKSELKMRESALKNNDFPSQDVIDEYMNFGQGERILSPEWKTINIAGLKTFNQDNHLWNDYSDLLNKTVELLVALHMNEMSWAYSEPPLPKRVLKKKKTTIQSVLVEWSINGGMYEVSVSIEKFTKLYPEMMEEYNRKMEEEKKQKKKQTTRKRKLKAEENQNQSTLTDHFQITKKAKLSLVQKFSAMPEDQDCVIIE